MDKIDQLKVFIEKEMGEILREKLSADEFNAVLISINMLLEEVSAQKPTTIYDTRELAEALRRNCEGCSKIKNLNQAVGDKEKIISIQRELMEMNNVTPLRISH